MTNESAAPHTRLVQIPNGSALILTRLDDDSSQIISIIDKHWRKYYTRVQLLNNFFDQTQLTTLYPSIDRHGRIVFAIPKKPFYFSGHEITIEFERRLGLLELATTSLLIHYEVDSKYSTSILDSILKRLHFDYIFYDVNLNVPSVVDEIREKSSTPQHVLNGIYTEIESALEV
jgi:hypothetical protein